MHIRVITSLFLFLLYRTHGLDNGLALTPPMGWLSWQRFRCLTNCSEFPDECISEHLFKRIADRMFSDGYLDAGYEYIIIDDCWQAESRDSEDHLQADPIRFPNGIKALADYIHNLGLKFGIYGDYGTNTCMGYPGSIDHLQLDAETLANWGVDYFKFDGCYADTEGMEKGYAQMAGYLNATGRPIVFSCSFPAYLGLDANYSMAVEHCNLWRNYGDIDDAYDDIVDIGTWFADNQEFLIPFAGPGHWNDPDMLIIGNYGLSLEQSKSQMTMWCILAAPLLMSVDLDIIRPEFKSILLNKDAIRINQDPLGIQGELVSNASDIMLWSKPLVGTKESHGLALGVVSNRTDGYLYPYTIQLGDFFSNRETKLSIKNVFEEDHFFEGKKFSVTDEITVRIPPTGAVLILITPIQSTHMINMIHPTYHVFNTTT